MDDILQILIEKNLIQKDEVALIVKEANEKNIPIEQALLNRGIPASSILQAKGEYLEMPTRSLDGIEIPRSVLEYVPEDSARHYSFVPIAIADGVLEVGITDPDNVEGRDALNFIASKINMPFKIFLISKEDFDRVIASYKGLSGEVNKALDELETELKIEADTADKNSSKKEGGESEGVENEKISEDAPVTKIVATILRYATDGSASDVHIEPQRETVKIRFRVDGVLMTSLVLPFKVHSAVVARIKILCNMRLDEKRKPQDGRFSARIEGRKIDFRVSTFPTYFGEKVVMRLLDQEKGVKKLDDLGLSLRNIELIRKALKKPYGLILISGPTGSGKTSTLYSMITELDMEHQNVLSLEDPIEYNIEGMSQSQVRPEIDYTFASGLRTTLRQDPDVIMVGEIRDKETAQLAIQAALTGHLVLSTIHTNSAVGVIPRLIDMGVDPYLIAPTLILAIAQCLVSVLCPNSGKPIPVEGSIQIMVDKQFEDLPLEFKNTLGFTKEVYEILPTSECPNGVRGRRAVMEVLEMDKEIESIILKSPTEIDITRVARKKGMLTMKEDAILKAMNREIPFEEVNTL
ncbi:MAG: ATPase, T2SS/T4P/T4SS family [Candidatus Zambryskibacteria bacterium]|nr:ATPase, T2SS/T4P/T4SS family [Candidatus Zambryskibacteria bacterium]